MQMPLETPEVGPYAPRPRPDIDRQSSESLGSCEDSGEISVPVLKYRGHQPHKEAPPKQ